MKAAEPAPEIVHASCVAIGGRGVLIAGRSGSGKSDLSLRLIDRGAILVSDDYTLAANDGGRLVASAPDTIVGKIEVRGIGLIELDAASGVPICLLVDLDRAPERLPEGGERTKIAGVDVPTIGLAALEASAAIKLEYALCMFGLPPELST